MKSIYTSDENPFFQYVLGLGDDALILGQRWSEWLSKGPNLELDIAASNLALDLLGQAEMLLTYAAELEGKGRTADGLSFLRDGQDFRNHWLVEQPNDDWGVTTARMLMFSIYQYLRYEKLAKSSDARLAEIATKALKEVSYHRRFAAEWTIRLGGGTEESNRRVQRGFDILWRFVPELFETVAWEQDLAEKGLAAASDSLRAAWDADLSEILAEADLKKPEGESRLMGSRHNGHHSEHLGTLLCELQYLQRTYPTAGGAVW
ncbi:1,2-phenylacetyl-CoA epoxidase subunit PaaC [Kordiimonas pumila]|uniref:1,2-phenylacetyl-CoA epoxidase subunit PaaC n=1 Tax=Kordiimonas pumila TaxID=2161677 RepID=A0ABV7CZH4_9PROT|nr:1,2-phenylacetyl-CoA epoxidase subunit PaaC [Kordiimonas pumila]